MTTYRPSGRTQAVVAVIIGALIFLIGVWLIFPPVSLILAGAALVAVGILVVNVEDRNG